MANIIQTLFLLIPSFKVENFSLIPIIWLVAMGLFIEKHYVSRLTFFSNSIALVSYFGLKENISILGGLFIIIYFGLALWSFLAYATNDKIPKWEEYEQFIKDNPWMLKIGGSLITGGIILFDLLS